MKISLWQSGSGLCSLFRAWSAEQWRRLGHEVVPLPPRGGVEALGDIVFSMNFLPDLARLAKRIRKPYVCWVWDPLVNYELLNPDWASDYTVMFHFARSDLERFRRSGYRNVFHLPLSTDVALLAAQAATAGKPRHPVVFVGNCYRADQSEFREYRRQYLAHGIPAERGLDTLDRFVRAVAAEPGRNWRAHFDEFVAREQPGLFDTAPCPEPERARTDREYALDYFVNQLLYHEADIVTRSGVVRALLPLGAQVWGDAAGWSPHVGPDALHAPAVFEKDLGTVLASGKICVNITRAISDGANMRSFEIPAAGAFQLALFSDEMASLFTLYKEIVCYRTPEEARDLADYYLRHGSERWAIAEAGRRRVLAEHTLDKRFASIAATLKSLGV